LGVLAVAAVGVALWVGVAAGAAATDLGFLTRLCGVADASGLGLAVSVWDSANGIAMKESNAIMGRRMRTESVLSKSAMNNNNFADRLTVASADSLWCRAFL
jgi:hypothetical protein